MRDQAGNWTHYANLLLNTSLPHIQTRNNFFITKVQLSELLSSSLTSRDSLILLICLNVLLGGYDRGCDVTQTARTHRIPRMSVRVLLGESSNWMSEPSEPALAHTTEHLNWTEGQRSCILLWAGKSVSWDINPCGPQPLELELNYHLLYLSFIHHLSII